MLAISGYVTSYLMQTISAVKVGLENGECMQYNNVVIMHSYVGKIYMVSRQEKNKTVPNGQTKGRVVRRSCGHFSFWKSFQRR